jgi:hypothetical protein
MNLLGLLVAMLGMALMIGIGFDLMERKENDQSNSKIQSSRKSMESDYLRPE